MGSPAAERVHPEHRARFIRSSRSGNGVSGRPGDRETARKVPGWPGAPRTSRPSRISASAQWPAIPVSIHAQGNDLAELNAWTPRVTEALRGLAPGSRPDSNQQDRGSSHARHRPPDGLSARHHPKLLDNTALRRLRTAAGLDHLHAAEPVHVVMEVEPRLCSAPTPCGTSTCGRPPARRCR